MIRGVIYLTGLVTLGAAGLALAVAYEVHKWPWREYVDDGRRVLVDKLDPRAPDGPAVEPGRSPFAESAATALAAGQTGSAEGRPDRPFGSVDSAAKTRVSPWHDGMERGGRGPGSLGTHGRDACAATEVRHTVRSGETLYQIAQRYFGTGELWPAIAADNGIARASDLHAGAVLVIRQDRGREPADGGRSPVGLRLDPAVGTSAAGARLNRE